TVFAVNDGREADENGSLLTGSEKRGFGNIRNIGSRLENAESAGTASMNDPFRHTFTIETGKLLDKVRILQQHRTHISSRLGMAVLADGCAVIPGELRCRARCKTRARWCLAGRDRCRAGLHTRRSRNGFLADGLCMNDERERSTACQH